MGRKPTMCTEGGLTLAECSDCEMLKPAVEQLQRDMETAQGDITSLQGDMTEAQGDIISLREAIEELEENIWKKIYPVGSIYISADGSDPNTLFGGTWTQLDDGYYLRASSSGAGDTLDEELPNVKGQTALELANNQSQNGALKITKQSGSRSPNWSGDRSWGTLYFDASKSNSVYKDNGKVQPKSYKVAVYKRVS